MKRTAKNRMPQNVMTLEQILELHTDQMFHYEEEEEIGQCYLFLERLSEHWLTGLVHTKTNLDGSIVVSAIKEGDTWEPGRMIFTISPARRSIKANSVRQTIMAVDLMEWCKDKRFRNANIEVAGREYEDCEELLRLFIENDTNERFYIVHHPDDSIDVYELFVTRHDCWLPGQFLGTIEAKVQGVEELV